MGCQCTKRGTNNTVAPVKDSTNQSVSALNDAVIGQQTIESLDVTLKQPVSNDTNHSRQNNKPMVDYESIDQSVPIPLENSKSSSSDKSTKHEDPAVVPDATNSPISTSQGGSMQTFKQISTYKKTNEYLSQRTNSGISNKRSITAKDQHEQDDQYSEKSNDETVSISSKSIVKENINTMPDNTDDLIEKENDNSIEKSTISENLNSKRINSGVSNKRPISANSPQVQNDHHSEKLDAETVSISNKSMVEESTHTIPDTTDGPVEKHTDDSIEKPTISETLNSKRIHSEAPHKHPITENNQQESDDRHSKASNEETVSVFNKSMLEENINTMPDNTDDLIEKENDNSIEKSTISENLNSKRINSGVSNKRPISANSPPVQNDHHSGKLDAETVSISNKSMVEEIAHTIPDTTDGPVEEHIDDSMEQPTISVSKRIDSGTSAKHSLSSRYNIHQNGAIEGESVSISDEAVVDATINALPTVTNNHAEIVDAHPEAFSDVFVQQRQNAIDNDTYRSNIESWEPNSLQQLIEAIENLSKGKSLIDSYWMIFYWIAYNIEYDVVSFFNHDIPSQSAEEVFRTKKGVSAGYSHLYKYLCDQLGMKCEEISGYAKGYAFEKREQGVGLEKDHAWNAVQINDFWYLIDPTWGTGHLAEKNIFKRELDCFYFLARPHQIIYQHLPEDDRWQLLRTPINKTEYEHMPKIRPPYFNLNLELISPLHQEHVSLVRDKPYALVLIRAPTDVDILGSLKLNENKIEGGHRIVFDRKKQLYRCYFAPVSTGEHQVCLFAKNVNSATNSYKHVLDFTLNVDQLPQNPVSYPTTWKKFYDLDLKVLSPVNTHLIKVGNGATQAHVIIEAPNDIELIGNLRDNNGTKIEGGEQVYYDREKSLWRCNFAPNRDGLFEANILGRKKSKTGKYSSVISFKIEANQISSPTLSYPHTWQLFYDLDLKVESPQNCSIVPWPDHTSYVEVLIRAPDDVQLSCKITHNNVDISNGSLAQFDHEKMLWQLLFAPQNTGEHDLVVFAKRNDEENAGAALKFHLNVTQLNQSTKFPTIHKKFRDHKCRIYEPLHGVLKKDTTIPIHCIIPGATDVRLTIDSNWIKANGYQNPIIKQNITVGSKEVTIYANYGQESSYDGLVEYTVI